MPPSDETRLLIVEDVPQVAQYIRGLLNAQSRVKLIDVLSEGGKAIAAIQELRPDVVLVDALLQGRIKGPQLVQQIHELKLGVPVIVLTVPQNPIEPDPAHGINGVLVMPFSGFDLMTRIATARKEFEALEATISTRVMSVFAPKGGVGKTTIAFNLAVALGQIGQRTVLIDGSLQFGDLRSLLKVPADAPSILDLPTDRIAESDSTTIHNTVALAETFRSIGYPASKVRYLINRADSLGGLDPADLERALGRVPEHRVISDDRLVVKSNNEGVPFVLAEPAAPISQDIARIAVEILNAGRVAALAGRS